MAVMPSEPPPCCGRDAHGFIHEDFHYSEKGHTISISANHTLYAVGSGTRCIIMVHDIFGVNTGMHKRICDELSQRVPNSVVIAPDFYHGDSLISERVVRHDCCFLPHMLWKLITGQYHKFARSYPWESVVGPYFAEVMNFAKRKYSVEKFCIIGFCSGAYYAFKACGAFTKKYNIVCSASVHPSVHYFAKLFHEKEKQIIDLVTCPQLILSTPTEPSRWHKGGLVQKMFKAKGLDGKCEFVSYRQRHGFVTRGDLTNPSQSEDIEDVLRRVVQFFSKYLDDQPPPQQQL